MALWAVLVFAAFPATVFSEAEAEAEAESESDSDSESESDSESSCTGIHVKILNIKNSTGTIACALFESPAGFPTEFLQSATNIMMLKIRDTQARCNFLDITPGTYALAVIHDENMDGKLNANWLGVPTEGYGFSSGAEASMSAPSFKDASFSYDREDMDLTIELNY